MKYWVNTYHLWIGGEDAKLTALDDGPVFGAVEVIPVEQYDDLLKKFIKLAAEKVMDDHSEVFKRLAKDD